MSYDTFTEAGMHKRNSPASAIYFPQASAVAQQVFARDLVFTPPGGSSMLRVWPVGSYASGVALRAAAGKAIRAAEWRPGTKEIGVLFDDHLEFWTATGTRRSVALPPMPASTPNASLLFRADGNAVLIGRQPLGAGASEYVLAVDLTTGQTAVLDWNGLPGPGTSVHLSPP
jgi:hypothetical protein